MVTEVQDEARVQQRLFAPVIGEQERNAGVIALRALLRRGELVDQDADVIRGLVEAMQTAPPFVSGGHYAAAAFDLQNAAKDRMGKFARGSSTSRTAALRNYPRSGTQRMEVLHRVARAGEAGATRDELVVWTGKPHNVVTPRVKELVDGGWLEPKLAADGTAVTRRTRAGSEAAVLCLTSRARTELRRRGSL